MDSKDDQHLSVTQIHATTNTDALSKEEVVRSLGAFRTALIWSNVVKAVILLLVLLLWVYLGAKYSLPWTWNLLVLLPIWESVFTLTYGMRHKQKHDEPGEPLLRSARNSLNEIENQIWLQRNVLWWRFLPYFVSVVAFVAEVVWSNRPKDWLHAFGSAGMVVATISAVAFAMIVVYFVGRYAYSVSQHATLSGLETRRQELLALLARLGDRTTREDRHVSGA